MAGKKDEATAPEGAKAGKKKLIIIGAAAAVLLAGGGTTAGLVLGKDASAATAETAEEVLTPGDITALDPISLNLSDGYLKLGLALQGVAAESSGHGSSSGLDGSKAYDQAISYFSGLSMAELSDPVKREEHKTHLQEKIIEAYTTEDHETGEHTKTVMGIYLTQFVMQAS
ncbi:flagellar basal body-associated FliL family protein [Kineococcus glutinatus]|uniref:Flagellar protein FliL n=1 Tax=Kineococcus glutinatus TaxID=1070872 RepID=A0ABP9HJD4_9ACTN